MWLKQVWVCLVLVAGTQALHEPQERETVDDFIINGVDAQNIRSNLRFVYTVVHPLQLEVTFLTSQIDVPFNVDYVPMYSTI